MGFPRTVRTLMLAGTVGAFALHGLAPASAAPAAEESCFLSAINSARASAGVGSLSVQGDLLRVATVWSQTMADAGYIFHNANLANVVPSNWLAIGENVGVGPTCDSIAQAFMNSPEHRRNILDPAYTTVGVGVVDSADGTVWVTEDFMGVGAAVAPVAPAAPVVAQVPAPVVTAQAPGITALGRGVEVTAPSHARPATPATPKPSTPVPLPSHVVERPVTSAPAAAQIPVATPIVDEILTVQASTTPGGAPTAGSGHHGFLESIAAFFAHLL